MKVFLAGTSLLTSYGGPAYSASRLASALAARGIRVGLWAPDQSAVTTTLIPSVSGIERLGGELASALGDFGTPDVIHDNGIWMPHNHRIAGTAAKLGLPRIVSTRGMLEPWAIGHKRLKKKVAWSLYQRRDLKRASVLHATNEQEAENLRVLGLCEQVVTIPNGIDLPGDMGVLGADGDVDSARTALFLGRLYPVKGLPLLIEAWNRVRPEGWKLVIAGPDEAGHKAGLVRAITDADLGGCISFAGEVEGARKDHLLRSASLFVLPTHSESFGMAIGEALSYGVPVLTTLAAPWPELSRDHCGWRVTDTVEGVTEGLRAATSLDAGTLAAMGASGRSLIASDFQWDAVAARFELLYARMARPH